MLHPDVCQNTLTYVLILSNERVLKQQQPAGKELLFLSVYDIYFFKGECA